MSSGGDASAVISPIVYGDWLTGQGMSSKTVEQRVEFADWRLREWPRWEVSASQVAMWLSGYNSWTRITYQNHLVSLFKWLVEIGHVERSPMDGMRRPMTPVAAPQPLSPAEVEAVLDGVTGHLRSWMLLALLAGLRAHEIAKIRGEDITADRLRVVGKGGKDAWLPTHPDLWALAQQYPRRGYWFPARSNPSRSMTVNQITKIVGWRFREVGIESGAIHRLRATYGTNLVRAGANLRVVQTLMRHSSLATTERYLGVDEDERVAAIGLLGV